MATKTFPLKWEFDDEKENIIISLQEGVLIINIKDYKENKK